jgi:hypothetical protein
MLFCLDDAVLFRNEANKNGKFEVAQRLHLDREAVIGFIHLQFVAGFACGADAEVGE